MTCNHLRGAEGAGKGGGGLGMRGARGTSRASRAPSGNRRARVKPTPLAGQRRGGYVSPTTNGASGAGRRRRGARRTCRCKASSTGDRTASRPAPAPPRGRCCTRSTPREGPGGRRLFPSTSFARRACPGGGHPRRRDRTGGRVARDVRGGHRARAGDRTSGSSSLRDRERASAAYEPAPLGARERAQWHASERDEHKNNPTDERHTATRPGNIFENRISNSAHTTSHISIFGA